MGFVQADWHITVGTVDRSDPFEGFQVAQRDPDQDPYERLRELISKEAALDGRGITCPLKDECWAHPRCSTCPERGTADRAELCRVGMAQEETLACLSP